MKYLAIFALFMFSSCNASDFFKENENALVARRAKVPSYGHNIELPNEPLLHQAIKEFLYAEMSLLQLTAAFCSGYATNEKAQTIAFLMATTVAVVHNYIRAYTNYPLNNPLLMLDTISCLALILGNNELAFCLFGGKFLFHGLKSLDRSVCSIVETKKFRNSLK